MDLLAAWNSLTQSPRENIVGGIIATLVGGVILAVLTFVVARLLRKKESPATQVVQPITQQVVVNVPAPQPLALESQPVEPTPPTSPQAPPIPRTPPYGFVARYDDERNDLAERVIQLLKQNRAVALLGSGGVGKTTLAAEIVRKFLPAPASSGGSAEGGSRVVWTSADGRADFVLTTLLDEAAAQLGSADLRTLALEQKTNAVRDLLVESRAMIVLDNFETIVVEQQKAIAAFVNTLSGPALITSRLAVEGAERVSVDAMSPEETRDFLTRLIANSPKRNTLTMLMDDIAQISERNPMVMRWIVGQLELAQRRSDVLDELSHGEGDAATRVFGRSFGLLNADSQAALLSLAVFVPSADRAAVASTAGMGNDVKRLNAALRPLAGLQLLETDEKSERLSIIGLTRRFTSAQLDKDSNAAEDRKRFVDYFVRYAEAHAQTTPEDFNALEAKRENLLAAMDVAFAAEDWQSVICVMDAIGMPADGFLSLRGYWDDAISRGEQAAKAARGARDKSAAARFSGNVAIILEKRGDYDKAREVHSQVMEIYKRLNEQSNVAVSLHQLGMIAQDQGDYETARQRYAESLEIKKKLGDQSGIAITLHQLGMIAQDQGDYETARQRYAESLEIAKKLGDQSGIASTLHQLGNIAYQQGDYETARRRYAENLEIEKIFGNQSVIAITLHQLGNIAYQQGDYETARQRYAESLEIKNKLGDQSGIASTLHQLGNIVYQQGDYETARQRYAESLEIAEKLNNQNGIAITLHQLGNIAYQKGKYETARQRYTESLEIKKKLGDQSGIAITLHQLGRLAEIDEDKPEAARLFQEALEIFQRLKSPNAKIARKSLERVTKKTTKDR